MIKCMGINVCVSASQWIQLFWCEWILFFTRVKNRYVCGLSACVCIGADAAAVVVVAIIIAIAVQN